MLESKITIFPNITSKEPRYISVLAALNRIKEGKSKEKVEKVRNAETPVLKAEAKKQLPSVCFSGEFLKDRKDTDLIKHSGFMVLDFDHVENLQERKDQLFQIPYIAAVWVSPSGDGLKALARIKDHSRHREHFEAIKTEIKDVDKSGVNVSRVCFESYDPKILYKETCEEYLKFKVVEVVREQKPIPSGNEVFEKLVTWLTGKGEAFRTGERNNFLFKLASACCRFGMNQEECHSNLVFSFLSNSTDFSIQELSQLVKSAYRANNGAFGTASFERDVLVTKTTLKEVEIDSDIYDLEVKPKDVIFGDDVKQDALDILRNGYPKATPLYMGEMDNFFKWKKGEITCLTGIANMGKSSILKQLLLLQAICEGARIGIYAPEDFPAHEYYHELCEMYIGNYCTPNSLNRPSEALYESVYDFISDHFYFVYPKEAMPTVSYIKERFLELIIKKKIEFCVIDPFNQLDKGDFSQLRDDQYLDKVLAELTKFARDNNQNFIIVAHPNNTGLKKNEEGDYLRPDANNIAGGTMWYNKMDNILCYHRPFSKSDPSNPICELESIKIRRVKVVGKKGVCEFSRNQFTQRFLVGGIDYIKLHIDRLTSEPVKEPYIMQNSTDGWDTPTDYTPF